MITPLECIPPAHRDLFGVRTDTPYTEAERRYGAAVQARLEQLLQGDRARLTLMRHYHGEEDRLAVLKVGRMDPEGLRPAMVERILISTLTFLRDVTPGGPVNQQVTGDYLIETQPFSTRYPHILIERIDVFQGEERRPHFTEWRLRRTQNQKAETRVNRWLDAANLGLSVLRSLGG